MRRDRYSVPFTVATTAGRLVGKLAATSGGTRAWPPMPADSTSAENAMATP